MPHGENSSRRLVIRFRFQGSFDCGLACASRAGQTFAQDDNSGASRELMPSGAVTPPANLLHYFLTPMRTLLLALALLPHAVLATAQQPQLNFMPMPSTVQLGTGQLPITQSFSLVVTGTRDASMDRGVQRFVAQLSAQTGIPFRAKPGSAKATLSVHVDHGREAVQKLGEDESYELTITESGAKLTAPTPLGALYGLQTFLQLVQPTP